MLVAARHERRRRRCAVTGSSAAAFRHRTSRAGDPHLHTHVLVANATRSADGRGARSTPDTSTCTPRPPATSTRRSCAPSSSAASGVEWGPVRQRHRRHRRHPPTRARRVLDPTQRDRGRDGAARGQLGARRGIRGARDPPSQGLRRRTAASSALAGRNKPPSSASTPTSSTASPLITPTDEPPTRAAIVARLLGPDGLTQHASTFDRRDVLRAWCEQLPDGADIATIEQLADQTLADPQVVPLAPRAHEPTATLRRRKTGRPIDTPTPGLRYSTQSLLALETRLVHRAADSTGDAGRCRRRGRRPRRVGRPPRPVERTGRDGRRAHHLRTGARRRDRAGRHRQDVQPRRRTRRLATLRPSS